MLEDSCVKPMATLLYRWQAQGVERVSPGAAGSPAIDGTAAVEAPGAPAPATSNGNRSYHGPVLSAWAVDWAYVVIQLCGQISAPWTVLPARLPVVGRQMIR